VWLDADSSLQGAQSSCALTATAIAEMGRNADRRLRIQAIAVKLTLGKSAGELEHLDRVLSQFADFCTVSMSVQQGIAIGFEVVDSTGSVLTTA
jgi:hypothetical protein